MLDTYMSGILQPGAVAKEQSSQSEAAGATNQTSDSGVGLTGEAMDKLPTEISKIGDWVEGKVMSELETFSSMPTSGAPMMAILAVIVILALIGVGLRVKRR